MFHFTRHAASTSTVAALKQQRGQDEAKEDIKQQEMPPGRVSCI
jgi:hypothetical protein